ncbi:MAG: MarC family protein [Puniceicoccales bacterium]|jgi:multiple antibiotic resistance protein|nr:MarC family protein [Puniceicoccales bacterium]
MSFPHEIIPFIGTCEGCGYVFFVNCFLQTFMAMCPFAVIAFYLSMTVSCTRRERLMTAKMACWVAWSIMVLTALGGPKILTAVGIAIEAFNIGGGLMLIVVGFNMLRAEDPEIPPKDETDETSRLPKKMYQDIAITPLAVPLIAGPSMLTVVLANRSESQGPMGLVLCLMAISLAIFLMYIILILSSKGVKWLTPTVLKLGCRLSGLFLVALGVQFIMSGLREMGLGASSYVIASVLGF